MGKWVNWVEWLRVFYDKLGSSAVPSLEGPKRSPYEKPKKQLLDNLGSRIPDPSLGTGPGFVPMARGWVQKSWSLTFRFYNGHKSHVFVKSLKM